MTKKALCIGANGQDGSYLLELLLAKGYEVHGTIRRSSVINTERIDHLMENKEVFGKNLFIHYGDVTDASNINALIVKIQPDEIYNLSAQSHVKVSFELPSYTGQVDALGVLNILEAVRNLAPHCKVYQASTSELYGGMGYNMPDDGYTEESPFHPRSPYGCAKIYGYWIIKNYREAYNMFACNGILFNHESPRRGDTFVTKKITNWFRNIDKEQPLQLGNINAYRDWGHAKDYVEAMWLMLQQDEPEDFVIATNKTYSVRDFINECCKQLGYIINWEGTGINEVGTVFTSTRIINTIKINEKYFRPSEVEYLLGNANKAKEKLGWVPKCDFHSLVHDMLNG
jgi:GDPmannose 4,6-dehydratase